jgi:hypothetical protein
MAEFWRSTHRTHSVGKCAYLSSSVRYFGASSIAFFIDADCCAASSSGGGVVRLATGVPSSLKNSSWPDGEQMQSILTGFEEELWNSSGAFAGMWTVDVPT